MLKLLSVVAILAIAHAFPIEQDKSVPLENSEPSRIETALKPEDVVLDSTPVPEPESESSVFDPESEKHEEAKEEPIKGDAVAEVETSIPNFEADNHQEPPASESIVEAVPAASEVFTNNPESNNHEEPIVSGPIVEAVPAASEFSTNNPESFNQEEPIVSEPTVEAEPAAIEVSTNNPEPDNHEEPIVSGPSEISTISPESDKHETAIQPVETISKPEHTVIPDDADDDDSDEELEAALDQFFQFLNLTDSDEMEDVVIGSILLEMFEGLDEIITGLEQMAFTGERAGTQALLKRISDMNIFEDKAVPSLKLPTVVNDKNHDNQQNRGLVLALLP